MREFELQNLKSLRSAPLICIKITSSSGKESNVTVSLRDTVNAVKDKALGGEYSKESPFYKLILARSNRELIDEKTLEEENVQENDELILFKKRHNASGDIAEKECKTNSYQVPDLKGVKKLTAKLPAGNAKEPSAILSPLTLDFNSELRRILISLIDSSILLQSVVTEEKETDSSGQEEDVQPTVDPAILKQLTDMGFKEIRAIKALILNRMSPMPAMEWLLQHESDADIDEPLVLGARAGRTRRKRKEFVPNPRAVNNLKEMGFQEEEILMALKATGNNQEAACDWLLGDRQLGGIGDINEGLDQSSPLYQAIMENPLVQLSLNNARVLGAFEDMLENPSTSSFYINDPETGPVLLQVSRIVQGFAR
ncbi:Ubiquitin-associated domain-containing protein 1 [Desmophyllum pertusum]|uniref:Ubiquitin-associated domain-containing protein 1 n=1 Tax=Desmophyllum pertusum TaxID=174260 RepID=A0A9W9YD49_9CNID|nr:Ubiquitin-associated domain-containing protein 1 [Desmophyllum pertusum]